MNQTVTMYSMSWCGYCRRARAALEQQGIAFQEIDIEQRPELAATVEEWNGGNRTVPTFRVGEEVVTYKDRARLRDLIGADIP